MSDPCRPLGEAEHDTARGTVLIDAERNSRLDAGEDGVAGATV